MQSLTNQVELHFGINFAIMVLRGGSFREIKNTVVTISQDSNHELFSLSYESYSVLNYVYGQNCLKYISYCIQYKILKAHFCSSMIDRFVAAQNRHIENRYHVKQIVGVSTLFQTLRQKHRHYECTNFIPNVESIDVSNCHLRK